MVPCAVSSLWLQPSTDLLLQIPALQSERSLSPEPPAPHRHLTHRRRRQPCRREATCCAHQAPARPMPPASGKGHPRCPARQNRSVPGATPCVGAVPGSDRQWQRLAGKSDSCWRNAATLWRFGANHINSACHPCELCRSRLTSGIVSFLVVEPESHYPCGAKRKNAAQLLLALCEQTPVLAVCQLLSVADDPVRRIHMRRTRRVRRASAEERSAPRGQRLVTVLCEAGVRRLLFATAGRKAAASAVFGVGLAARTRSDGIRVRLTRPRPPGRSVRMRWRASIHAM